MKKLFSFLRQQVEEPSEAPEIPSRQVDDDPWASLSHDDLRVATLRVLSLPHLACMWPKQADIDNARAWMTRTQAWLDSQTMPRRLRRHYQQWIDHVEHEAQEVETELRTGRRQRESKEYHRKTVEQNERLAKIGRLPRP